MRRFFQRRRVKICGLLLVLALAGGLAYAWNFAGDYMRPSNHPVPLPKDLAVEQVIFPSASGSTIHGWLVTSPTNHGVVILQHGIHADRGALVTRAKLFSGAGYSVLMFDFQAHGESPGKQITFGHLESRDSQAAVDFVKKRFPHEPIAVDGVSLGAAAAALAEPPLEVQALVLEMMYPTIEVATKDRLEMRLGPAGRCLSPLLMLQIPLRCDFQAADLRPLDAVAKITAPKLFLAGTVDHETKFAEAQAIFANAAEPKTFVSFEGVGHQDLLERSPDLYKKSVLAFLEQNLK
jgi:alpha-beta hydrolase superfamily lysophospholipase